MQDVRFDDPSGGVRYATTDVAIIWTPLDETGLDVEPLTEEPRRIVLSRDHRLADAPQITVEDVLGEPFPVSDSTDPVYERFWTLAEERGGPPGREVRITGQDELLVAARSGRLIAAMPQALVHQIPFYDIVAREVDGLRPAGVGSCRLAGDDNPLVEAFVQAVRQAAGH